jgi:hypothetical protein
MHKAGFNWRGVWGDAFGRKISKHRREKSWYIYGRKGEDMGSGSSWINIKTPAAK